MDTALLGTIIAGGMFIFGLMIGKYSKYKGCQCSCNCHKQHRLDEQKVKSVE